MTIEQQIKEFLDQPAFAVSGASTNREKYGNKCLRVYLQNEMKVYPINPRADIIEGVECLKSIDDLPDENIGLSIITPPKITEQVVKAAVAKGIKHIWMQPGAESPAAVEYCKKNDVNVIADGSCLLVALRYHEDGKVYSGH
jgi:predicted CoA-binding protein